MLEGLATWVLNTYLGQYLENLNTDQLSIGLLQGEVELENIPLRKDALTNLDLPIEVRAGFVGKIKLQIPVRRLRSDPWVISLDKLYVVAGPIRPTQYDEEKEEQLAQERKLMQLDAIEAKWKAEREAKEEASYYAASYSTWLSFGTSLVSNIVSNVQLKINNVHIRYEDDLTVPNQAFAWGITVQSLSAQSAKTNGEEVSKCNGQNDADKMKKLIELQNLAFYWDSGVEVIGDLPMAELAVYMQELLLHNDNSSKSGILHEYILEPVSAQALLIRNCSPSPLRSKTDPRLTCNLELEKFSISLKEAQYKNFIVWVREFERLDKARKYHKWRPKVSILTNAKVWWQFAITCHLEEIKKHYQGRNWTHVLERCKDINLYVSAYKEYLVNPATLSSDLQMHKNIIEQQLSFEELRTLREIAVEKLQKEELEKSRQSSSANYSAGQGLLQRWFPLWGGWYSTDFQKPVESEIPVETSEVKPVDSKPIEEEILDVLNDTVENNTLLRRDIVFAQLNFHLKQGTFILSSTKVESSFSDGKTTVPLTLFELEFADVHMIMESRPRSHSALFHIQLGALFLRDKLTKDSLFPLLVAPHSKEISNTFVSKTSFSRLASLAGFKYKTNNEPLFEFLYEKKPFNSTADFRVHIKSQSLDMVYNRPAISHIVDFFTRSHQKTGQSRYAELKLTTAAKVRYEELKRQTKLELRRNWDQIMLGNKRETKEWDISLDISAPQIIIPDNFKDPHTTLVIFDFGRFQFSNSSSKIQEKVEEEIIDTDDEDFKTPCSSPPQIFDLSDSETGDAANIHPGDLTQTLLHERIYDRYSLELLDLQVLVAKMKDNWKFAHLRGTSTMHVLDRFSISLYLERRTVFTSDPQWPSATLRGTLPKIVIHVNEHKIQALRHCLNTVSHPLIEKSNQGLSPSDSSFNPLNQEDSSSSTENPIDRITSSEESVKTVEESRLLIMQFCVDQMSLEVQSRGRSIAELQVTGVKAVFTKRPFDVSMALTVHSLLLVDAMQTFGPDFELLVASHKHVTMDSVSGSIRDSDPNSPTSPASPSAPKNVLTSPLILSAALRNLQSTEDSAASSTPPTSLFQLPPGSPYWGGRPPAIADIQDSEALISIELVIITPESPSSDRKSETLRIASVQFNNLDIIANQETIVELLGFLKLILPTNKQKESSRSDYLEQSPYVENVLTSENIVKTEITFDFHHLSVLLLRVIDKETYSYAQKVATATMSGARIQASLGGSTKIQGSLGGLQVLNLTPEASTHQLILGVGQDPVSEQSLDFSFEKEMYQTTYSSWDFMDVDGTNKAFSFTAQQAQTSGRDNTDCIEIKLQIASVCYTHSSHFLRELDLCLTEFKTYMANLASSIKTAATEVAIGIMNRGTDVFSTSFYGSTPHENLNTKSRLSSKLVENKSPKHSEEIPLEKEIQFKLDILLETPVIILPQTQSASKVLVAHLGRITIYNIHDINSTTASPQSNHGGNVTGTILERIVVEIRDINLYSMVLNVDRHQQMHKSFHFKTYLKSSNEKGQPILHDTIIELKIDRILEQFTNKFSDEFSPLILSDDSTTEHSKPYDTNTLLKVTGHLVTPLKVSISKPQYEQIIETLENLTFHETTDKAEKEQLSSEPEVKNFFVNNETLKAKKNSHMESQMVSKKHFMKVEGHFEVPVFSVELRGDLTDGEQGLVNVSFQDFVVKYEKNNPFLASIQVSLRALVMEDLLQELDSKHHFLIMSTAPEGSNINHFPHPKSQFLSVSCPDMMDHEPLLFAHQSLPDKLQTESIFQSFHKKKEKQMFGGVYAGQRSFHQKGSDSYPCTPPPSPSAEWKNSTKPLPIDTLVHINILLVDKKCPEFVDVYNSVNRLIDINFNCLETTFNLQSWVMVLDFLNIGASNDIRNGNFMNSLSRQNSLTDLLKIVKAEEQDIVNSEIELQVRSLTLILNKPEYELARANISNLTSRISMKNNNFSIVGKLGSVSLHDLTPHGHIYPERFSASGDEVLDFQFFKYGNKDENLERDYDMRLKIQMSSVYYIHTHRFYTETMAFFQYFNQLQNIMSRFRAAAAGAKVNDKAERASKILLDIHAESPVILIPQHSKSDSILVVNLGKLTINNKFMFSNNEGTISKVYRDSCIPKYRSEVKYDNMDLRKSIYKSFIEDPMCSSIYGSLDVDRRAETIERNILSTSDINWPLRNQNILDDIPENTKKYSLSADADTLYGLDRAEDYSNNEIQDCLLDVMHVNLMDVDLYAAERVNRREIKIVYGSTDIQFGSFTVRRKGESLLKEKCELQLQIEKNLDSNFSHSVPDMSVRGLLSAVHCSLDLIQYKLIRGILEHNLGEQIEEFQHTFPTSPIPDPGLQTVLTGDVWPCTCFHIDLVNVTLELLQNFGKEKATTESSLAKINFIKSRLLYESFSDQSKDIDLVFQEILISDTRFKDAPVNSRPNVFTNILQPTSKTSKQGHLQAELHYRATRDFTRFTILLNNMRVMAVFDWWSATYNFLMTSADNPYKGKGQASKSSKTVTKSSSNFPSQMTNSLAVSAGIITKRAPVINKAETPMELKLNITDTEIVVVEDASLWDTNSVILKSTAVISYRPIMIEKPLSCSLQSLEVFSCILGLEEDTALSIIDPVTVNIDICGKIQSNAGGGLLDATSTVISHTLEVSMHNLNIRVSYHDIKMFLQIIDSIPKQATAVSKQTPYNKHLPANFPSVQISKLEALGFSRSDCIKANEKCKGNLDEAALWLVHNAVPIPSQDDSAKEKEICEEKEELNNKSDLDIEGLELRISCVCFCLIDDCKDADVPLIEMTLTGLYLQQNIRYAIEGSSSFIFSADYYNRNLSGWEPFLEPWRCQVTWTQNQIKSGKQLDVKISASDILNINLTSALLDLYINVKTNWTEDYYRMNEKNRSELKMDSGSFPCSQSGFRRRSPFVPFCLKNDTGCNLWFATITTTPNKLTALDNEQNILEDKNLLWTEVKPGDSAPFTFEGRGKMRHRDTHELKIHQLLVRIEGWHTLQPVSVDRVGIYFRHAKPQVNRMSSITVEFCPARIVFEVTLIGSAQKLVTVRSALQLYNQLEDNLEVKLENTSVHFGGTRLLTIPSQHKVAVPLTSIFSQIWVRPLGRWSVGYCSQPIVWKGVNKTQDYKADLRTCTSLDNKETLNIYRFCVYVKREQFPSDNAGVDSITSSRPRISLSSLSHPSVVQPGHTITFQPPVILVNLLPYELHFSITQLFISGCIKAGKETSFYSIDINLPVSLQLSLENFQNCTEINIQPNTADYITQLHLLDNAKRLLLLQAKVIIRRGGSIKVVVYAPYWFINKSGLPLVFRQDGAQQDAAGQFEEHEMARSVTPLLFSFADREVLNLCSMRIGKMVHADGHPQWCQRFHLEKGIVVRRVRVSPKDSRPDWVYNIGIEVRLGRGRYHDTHIVTFSPRYQLDNQTSHKLQYTQKFATANQVKHHFHLSSMPNCTLPFHWPRLDLDQLLCVRMMDTPSCHWSGGFPIDNINSFHINMRDDSGKSHFIRLEIVLQGATFFIMFTDADKMPPPFRIDNFSEVPITYFQTSVREERLRTLVRPHLSVAYAWDEPTLPPFITCCAPGGSSATYNMNVFGDGKQLTYENFIYIAFTETFKRSEYSRVDAAVFSTDSESQDLVLDVPYGTRVVLRRKEPGKRSQLWRMTSTGMLQHEGSSPPRDPRKPTTAADTSRTLVLDIAGLSPLPGEYIPLMLRKPDERRRNTQTWHFTDDGRLYCGYPNMCVQSIDGFRGLKSGNDAVLGPAQSITPCIPVEQAIVRQRLWPGSGMLAVKVVPDGPTRVLQITDIRQKALVSISSGNSDWVVIEESNFAKNQLEDENGPKEEKKSEVKNELRLELNLLKGVGISVINRYAEELIYATLSKIVIEYTLTPNGQTLDGSVGDIKIDNQLLDAEVRVLLFLTPSSKNDNVRHLPAIHFTAYKMPSQNLNAEIFKHLMVTLKNVTLLVEERLLWKLLQFTGYNQSDLELEKLEENDFEMQRAMIAATSLQAKRYYFSTLKLVLNQVRLSVITSGHLPSDLQAIKHKMGTHLIRFEDAQVELDPFIRVHPFETGQFLLNSVMEHYREELKGQAAKILGAVDFLGNPLGLVNDVSEGLSGFINEGNVGGLFKNVTHGLSNSAAKMTGSLSDGLGRVTMDDKHELLRKKIRTEHRGRSSDHFIAGFKGLGFGILGGMTSLVTQTVEGAASQGIHGFFSGLGKGLVGTVAKPAVGVLDFASAAASAVRDTSRSTSHCVPLPSRPPRVCIGPGGLLPRYSKSHGLGQEMLFILNEKNYNERLIAYEQIRSAQEDMRALISTQQVYFLTRGTPPSNIVLTVHYSELYHCKAIQTAIHDEIRHYLELTMKADNQSGVSVPSEHPYKKPQVRCDSDVVTQWVAQQINYAKILYEEMKHTLPSSDDET